LKKILRKKYLDIFGKFAKPANGIHILNGHYISRDNGDAGMFSDMLDGLKESCRLVRIEDAVSLIVNRTCVKEPMVAFTFDDGFEECANMIAPVLESFHINAAFFINPGFIDGDAGYRKNFLGKVVCTPQKDPMTWDQIITLHRNGHIIGSHTTDHIRLTVNDNIVLSDQLKKSKEIIESRINAGCNYLAYPYGKQADLSPVALSLAKNHYKFIFSQSDYRHYFSFDGSVINRRHFEPDWPPTHVNYFLGVRKSWQ